MVGGTAVQNAGRGVGFDGGSLGIHFGCVSTNVQLILIAHSTIFCHVEPLKTIGNCFVFYDFFANNRTTVKSGCDGSIYCDAIISVETLTNFASKTLSLHVFVVMWSCNDRVFCFYRTFRCICEFGRMKCDYFCDVASSLYVFFGRWYVQNYANVQ